MSSKYTTHKNSLYMRNCQNINNKYNGDSSVSNYQTGNLGNSNGSNGNGYHQRNMGSNSNNNSNNNGYGYGVR